MYHFLTAFKDSTIYENSPNENFGADEILQLGRENNEESRVLVQFDLDRVRQYISSGEISGQQFESHLRLYTTEVRSVPGEYTIEVYPLNKEWIRGTGRKFNVFPIEDGVSWNSTGNVDWTNSGGDFNTSYSGEEKFKDFETSDLNVDVSLIVFTWVENVEENNGFLLFSDSTFDDENYFLNYFGTFTHTIYPPELVVKYDDSVVDTTTGEALEVEDDPVATFSGLEEEYRNQGIKRFRVNVKRRYESLRFVEDFVENPSPLYISDSGDLKYELVDLRSEKTLIPFSEYSKLSFDENGYYFDVDFEGFQPNRYYEINLRFDHVDGRTYDFQPQTNRFRIVKR